MEKKIHSFKFTRNDLIASLKKEGITSFENKLLEEALKQKSLTLAVNYYLDNCY